MLKKLQNLLFEDDDDDDMDEEEEAVPAPRPVKKPAERKEQPAPVRTEPAQEEPSRPSIQRIDVTQPVPKVNDPTAEKPVQGSVFRQEDAKPAEKKQKLGITIDDAPKARPAKKRAVPQQKTAKKEQKEKERQSYEFRPVISPIFGVDEKDMNALKNTTSRINNVEKEKKDPNISPIISPMYGVDEEDQPSMVGDTVEKSEANEKVVGNAHSYQAEDDIPEFSLDDILKVRDEEFEEQQEKAKADEKPAEKPATDKTAPLFPDLTLDEDEDEPADQTVVIKRDDLKDKK